MITSRYVVQVKCTGMGWCNSRHSAHTVALAEGRQVELLADDSAWLPGQRITRIWDQALAQVVETGSK